MINEIAKAIYEFHYRRMAGGKSLIWRWDPKAEWAQHWIEMAKVAVEKMNKKETHEHVAGSH